MKRSSGMWVFASLWVAVPVFLSLSQEAEAYEDLTARFWYGGHASKAESKVPKLELGLIEARGVTLVEAGPLFKWMEASFTYAQKELQVTCDGRRLTLRVGQNLATVDGKSVTMSIAPVEKAGSIYMPIQVLEHLGAKMENPTKARLKITFKEKQAYIMISWDEESWVDDALHCDGAASAYETQMRRGEELLKAGLRRDAEQAFRLARLTAQYCAQRAGSELMSEARSAFETMEAHMEAYRRWGVLLPAPNLSASPMDVVRFKEFIQQKVDAATARERRCTGRGGGAQRR
jgi:hypothetical protein